MGTSICLVKDSGPSATITRNMPLETPGCTWIEWYTNGDWTNGTQTNTSSPIAAQMVSRWDPNGIHVWMVPYCAQFDPKGYRSIQCAARITRHRAIALRTLQLSSHVCNIFSKTDCQEVRKTRVQKTISFVMDFLDFGKSKS